ncbi:MAG: hypothetical protein RDV48_12465 [Candidatus Eremiobacteraeota bacterium]|nr:hypothetical protein [Candidatus Eremiobacteraeota bacterium]
MKYTITAIANLRHYLPGASESMALEGGENEEAGAIARLAGIPEGEIMALKVGGEVVAPDYRLKEGEELVVYPVLSGG